MLRRNAESELHMSCGRPDTFGGELTRLPSGTQVGRRRRVRGNTLSIMINQKLDSIDLPRGWKRLISDAEALAFGKGMNREVADTVDEELKREVCEGHLLFNMKCRAVAYDAVFLKDFLFITDDIEKPLASVHFTWAVENEHTICPYTHLFRSLEDFLKYITKPPAAYLYLSSEEFMKQE